MEKRSDISPEALIAHLGCDYKLKPGHSGLQINIKTCPRCKGDKWKVFLNAETGLGNCFHGDCAGQPGFNLYTFARELLGSSSKAHEALELCESSGFYWKKSGTPIKQNSAGVILPESYALPDKKRHENELPDYLIRRNFTPSTAAHFEWRVCDRGDFLYTDAKGVQAKQRYDQRVILPVRDIFGVLTTFQGRDMTGHSDRKYLFPPGLPGSGRILYNAHRAIGSQGVIVCEGVFDVAATYQHLQAVKNDPFFRKYSVIGSFGKTLSMDGPNCQLMALLHLKQRGLSEIVMLWDGEPAAISSAMHTATRLHSILGISVKVAKLLGKDPNELPTGDVLRSIRMAQVIQGKTTLLRHGLMRSAVI